MSEAADVTVNRVDLLTLLVAYDELREGIDANGPHPERLQRLRDAATPTQHQPPRERA